MLNVSNLQKAVKCYGMISKAWWANKLIWEIVKNAND